MEIIFYQKESGRVPIISRIENAKDDHVFSHTLNKYAKILGYSLKMELVISTP